MCHWKEKKTAMEKKTSTSQSKKLQPKSNAKPPKIKKNAAHIFSAAIQCLSTLRIKKKHDKRQRMSVKMMFSKKNDKTDDKKTALLRFKKKVSTNGSNMS